MGIQVTKRDGTLEELDLNKLHKVVEFACEGLSNVSESEVELRAELQFFDGITTSEIQETLIKSAADLISEDTPNYQYVASRLINYDLRKRAYGDYITPRLYDIVKKNVELGFYEPRLLEWYTEDEFDVMDAALKHERDNTIVFAGMEQFRRKYLIRDYKKNILETPQVAYMLMGAVGFSMEDPKERMQYVKQFYAMASRFDFSLPTPIMAGVRSDETQFSSCVLVDVDDSLDSISASAAAIQRYAANRAGLGINVGRIRAVDSKVRNGRTRHTGIVPYIRFLIAALKSCSQGGIRNASATVCFPAWHYEFEDIIVLKNEKGTTEARVRDADYCVQLNRTLIERLVEGRDITLFSPNEVPGLYEAFFRSNDEFKALYEQYEADLSIRRRTIPAIEMFNQIITERKETGRIYLQFADNTNDLGVYDQEKALVYMTNLCVEITEHTKPLQKFEDPNAEIALCTLAAYNLGTIKEPGDFEARAKILVRFLDNLLDYQSYPVGAGENSKNRNRNLGIGIINLAYFLAKHNQSYTSLTAPAFMHPFVEAMAYYTTKASIELAAERGTPDGFNDTKWAKGIFTIDHYRKAMDDFVDPTLLLDWEKLRGQLVQHGIRNMTLLAGMPAETSAQIANATNGFEPPPSLITWKNSKDGMLAQVVPELQRLKNKYELRWDQESPRGYLNVVGVFNKFFCQSISTNTSYNPRFFEDNTIPMSTLLQDIMHAYRIGLRTLYYNNEEDLSGEIDWGDAPAAEEPTETTQVVEFDEDCDTCVL